MNRRQFCLGASLLAAGATGGCVTKAVWSGAAGTANTLYQDQIKAFYVSQDQRNFVVLSDQYHYIFQTESVIPVLQSVLRSHYVVNISQMRVDADANITGRLQFALPVKSLKPNQLREAQQLGFKPADATQKSRIILWANNNQMKIDESSEFLVHTHQISGQRFVPKANVNYGQAQAFYRAYSVQVEEERRKGSGGKRLGAMLITPITVAVDGALILFSAPLILIGAPLYIAALGRGMGK